MSDVEEANDDGGDPAKDVAAQNGGEAAGGHPDDADHSDHKTQDLVKAGRDEVDPNAGEE